MVFQLRFSYLGVIVFAHIWYQSFGNRTDDQLLSTVLRLQSRLHAKSAIVANMRQFTFEFCSDDSDCAAPRTCLSEATRGSCAVGETRCACVHPNYLYCSTSEDCLQNDRCVSSLSSSQCLSCNLNTSDVTVLDNGNCGSNVCIHVSALAHLDPSLLVYKQHKRAVVLCDGQENCATPGHMVIFKNVPMSMTTYCKQALVTCVRRMKFVNSPRMKIGIRLPSRSNDLVYTALAAPGETFLEKTVLRTLLYLGV